ncbi:MULTISPECIES: dUTP diphosphatase [Jeotgalibaca]|uniref:dUTP diphosphatase n=1 Tax=Jeotgalibaca TaxID=1470540 RepID=UPI00359FE752
MNFKKLQAMQAKLDEAILADKAPMTAEERFNKTLVALSVAIAEVANCAEHFKFWKDNKGKVDEKRFRKMDYGKHGIAYEDWGDGAKEATVDFEQAHHLTLIEECSDALHFILSLANQLGYEIDLCNWEISQELKEDYLIYVNRDTFLLFKSFRDKKSISVTRENLFRLIIGVFGYFESLGITQKELEQAYYDKNKINYERLEKGY